MMDQAVRDLLMALGVEMTESLEKTPGRVARMWGELLAGYRQTDDVLDTTFEQPGDAGIVLVRDIAFVSVCEHHLLPFTGVAHVAYIPNGRVVGLSKLARIVDVYAKRLQLQERLGNQVADAIERKLDPIGTAVILRGVHGCMAWRGVEKPGASMTTSVVRGVFKEKDAARLELMELLR